MFHWERNLQKKSGTSVNLNHADAFFVFNIVLKLTNY